MQFIHQSIALEASSRMPDLTDLIRARRSIRAFLPDAVPATLVREILEDVIEDIAFSKAIAEGEQSPRSNRESVFEVLESVN